MASAESFLWRVVTEIEPTTTQKEGAKRSHRYLRDLLRTGQMERRIIDDYLSGSYARDTAIRPLDDVDIIFVVNPDFWRSDLQKIVGALPTPDKILDSFANAIRYRYPVSSVFGQRRSVRLQLEHLDIDVVPAVRITENDPRILKIPDSDSSQWILTAPKIHEEKAVAVNRMREGKVKPLIKLLKFWNGNLPSTVKFKSFAIETMAIRVFNTIEFATLERGLFCFFDFIAYASGVPTSIRWNNSCGMDFSWYTCSIPDVSGTAINVAQGVTEDQKKKFLEAGIRARDKLIEASNSRYDSVAEDRTAEALRIR